jgi:hypothetical protein
MEKSEIIEVAERLKRIGGHRIEGRLATFQMTYIETTKGITVYLLVWRNTDDELLLFNELGPDYWNEDLLQELITQIKKAIEATEEQILDKGLKDAGLFLRSVFTDQNFENN